MTRKRSSDQLQLVAPSPNSLERYAAFIEQSLRAHSERLLQSNVWDRDQLISELGKALPAPKKTIRSIGRTQSVRFPPLAFGGPELTRNELKLYVVEALLDPRHDSYQWWYYRRPLLTYFADQSEALLASLGVECLADIASPMRPADRSKYVSHPPGRWAHNADLKESYAAWRRLNLNRKDTQVRTWVSGSELVTKEYASGPVAMIGEVHRWLVVKQEQMAPLDQRNILRLRDLFSEEHVRLTAREKRHDTVFNFYKFPDWLRPAARYFILDKIQHGECGPKTVDPLISTLTHLRDFMYSLSDSPGPKLLTRTLIEDDFIAWGKERDVRGYNWFLDAVTFLGSAARRFPESWPSLNIDKRAARKLGRGRTSPPREYLFERAEGSSDRAMPVHIAEAIAAHAHKLPDPCPLLFMLAVAIGARAEDLHALLFDALRPDPHDDRFVILHFWQNKVRRWNSKPLLRTDPAHAQLLAAIEKHRDALVKEHGKPTKHLFPIFHGSVEGFYTHQWSLEQIRRLCVEQDIRNDNGEVHIFKWHSLRHFRGTQMAAQGHDILAIMLELGHVSPDMAMTYVNRKLDLKKKALIEKGGGKFINIEGEVDLRVAELLAKKDSLVATRVAGGVCTLPHQLGDWCDHAHACLSCKHFRADTSCLAHFKAERDAIEELVDQQATTAESLGDKPRSSEVIRTRVERNKLALVSVNTILTTIRKKGEYSGTTSRFMRPRS